MIAVAPASRSVCDAEHPGPQERGRVLDAAVHVGLGREVHDRVGVRDEG